MLYDLQTRIFLLKKYYEFKSVTIVQAKYKAEYKKKLLQAIQLYLVSSNASKKTVQLYPRAQKTKNRVQNAKPPKISSNQ